AEDAPVAEPAVVERATAAPEPRAPRAATSGQPVVIVLDGDTPWENGGSGTFTVVHASPADVVAQATELQPSLVLVNLAAPGAFAPRTGPRAAGASAPLWACLAALVANRGIALGRVEPVLRPLDPDALLAALTGTAGRGTKVVTVGTDVDSLMSLRQSFT